MNVSVMLCHMSDYMHAYTGYFLSDVKITLDIIKESGSLLPVIWYNGIIWYDILFYGHIFNTLHGPIFSKQIISYNLIIACSDPIQYVMQIRKINTNFNEVLLNEIKVT